MRTNFLITASVMLTLCLASVNSWSKDNRAKDQANDAQTPNHVTVVFSYPKASRSVSRSEYPIIVLADIETGDEIRLKRQKGLQVHDATAGRYYIKQIENGVFNFGSLPISPPSDESKLMTITQGAVVYIGDITWSIGTGLSIEFSRSSLLEMQKMTYLHDSPLLLSSFGATPQPVSWD